jgi:DNA-binding HxlR family transcriptional regulator
MSAIFTEPYCAEYLEAAELIGARWSSAIIRVLFCDVTRFNDIAASVPGLSDRLLSVRLRELEAAGIVQASSPEGRHHREYGLTAKGKDLADVVVALEAWAERWKEKPPHKPLGKRQSVAQG